MSITINGSICKDNYYHEMTMNIKMSSGSLLDLMENKMVLFRGQFETNDGLTGCFFEVRQDPNNPKGGFNCKLWSPYPPDTNIAMTIEDIVWDEMVKVHECLCNDTLDSKFRIADWLFAHSDY